MQTLMIQKKLLSEKLTKSFSGNQQPLNTFVKSATLNFVLVLSLIVVDSFNFHGKYGFASASNRNQLFSIIQKDGRANTMNSNPYLPAMDYQSGLHSGLRVGPLLGNVHFWDLDKTSLIRLKQIALNNVPSTIYGEAAKNIPLALDLSAKYNIDPVWVLSIMWVESHYRSNAVSRVGALGPMQVMPATRHFMLSTMKKQQLSKQITKIPLPYRKEVIRDLMAKQTMLSAGYGLQKERPSLFNKFNNKFSNMLERNKIIKLKGKNSKQNKIRGSRINSNIDGLTDPIINIEMGIIYLKYLMDTFECPILATVAYNMGPTWVKQRIEKNLPVGDDNQYLNKVRNAYNNFSQNLL